MLGDDFTHILRVLNTNVDGRTKIMYAMTSIRGIGRRFSNLTCKKAEVDMRKRCGGEWGSVGHGEGEGHRAARQNSRSDSKHGRQAGRRRSGLWLMDGRSPC